MGVCRATHACFFCPCRGDFQSPESLLFHFLGFGRLEIAPTVRENCRRGKLLIFIAFIACRGDLQSPESLLFSFLRFRAIENRPYYPREFTCFEKKQASLMLFSLVFAIFA
jgi:hypothetical protein